SILGEFKILGNPCYGPNADSTYFAQSTFILPVEGKENAYIAMFDRWNKLNLEDSRYVWLPLKINGDSMVIQWESKWNVQ
ncbi:MAG: glycosyl hydrolase family 43, partial [Mariniphaga sp.]|nr:glycosyl hydrolase family 43 [Mariniphaga sp.]